VERHVQRPSLSYASEVDGRAKRLIVDLLEQATGRRRLEEIYAAVLANQEYYDDFWQAALAALNVRLAYDPARLAAVPRRGPLIFVANHPFGVVDGLALCHLASRVRRDWRILIHAALCREERISDYLLPIDFREGEAAIQTNIATRRQALELLRNDGALVIFPAGGIATAVRPFGKVTDLDWKLFAARLIHAAQATVTPVYFHGQNSQLFQLVSQYSLTLRLALIIHEVNRQIGKPVRLTIGESIPYERLAPLKGRQELIDHLRRLTYGLAGSPNVQVFPTGAPPHLRNRFAPPAPAGPNEARKQSLALY
jgi:putative hemolysin